MEDELVKIMEKYVLIKKEKERSVLQLDDMKEGIKECKLNLIGKAIGEKITNYICVKIFVMIIWGCTRRLRVSEIGKICISLVFRRKQI